jgi:hypothetical protein
MLIQDVARAGVLPHPGIAQKQTATIALTVVSALGTEHRIGPPPRQLRFWSEDFPIGAPQTNHGQCGSSEEEVVGLAVLAMHGLQNLAGQVVIGRAVQRGSGEGLRRPFGVVGDQDLGQEPTNRRTPPVKSTSRWAREAGKHTCHLEIRPGGLRLARP